jgi:hypothetical protein
MLKSSDADEEYYAWDALGMLDYQDEAKPFKTKKIGDQRYDVPRAVV